MANRPHSAQGTAHRSRQSRFAYPINHSVFAEYVESMQKVARTIQRLIGYECAPDVKRKDSQDYHRNHLRQRA